MSHRPQMLTGQEGCSSCSEYHPVLLCDLQEEKTQTTLGHFFKRVDRTESSKQTLGRQHQTRVTLKPVLCLLLLLILQLCHLLPSLPPPVSNFLSAHSVPALYASYCVVVLYFSRHCTVRLNTFYFLLIFMYYLCEKYHKSIKYSTRLC